MTTFASRGPRVHGVDRAIMRIGLATLVWARRRSGASLSAAEHARIRAAAEGVAHREREWALRAARVL